MNDDMPRKLPLHVTRERTRHGKVVFYFRVGNGKRRRLPQIGTPEFEIAYQAFLTGGDAPKPVQSDNKSLQWLVAPFSRFKMIEPTPLHEHQWHTKIFSSMKLRCCINCGFLENHDKPNKPCPGPIGVSFRAKYTTNDK